MLDGCYFDLSRSRPIGAITAPNAAMFEAAVDILNTGINAIRPGAWADDVARAGLGRQEELGFPRNSVFSGLGHGIGLGWDAPWLVPSDDTVLQPGMVLSVERTVTRNGYLGDFEDPCW